VPVLPLALLVTLFCPMNCLPSFPEGLEKYRMVKIYSGVLLKRPAMAVELPEVIAESSTGLFWRLFGPVSESCGSLAVPAAKSMPRPTSEKTEMRRMRLLVPEPDLGAQAAGSMQRSSLLRGLLTKRLTG